MTIKNTMLLYLSIPVEGEVTTLQNDEFRILNRKHHFNGIVIKYWMSDNTISSITEFVDGIEEGRYALYHRHGSLYIEGFKKNRNLEGEGFDYGI